MNKERNDFSERPDEAQLLWETTIRERIARYDEGKAKTRSASEVFENLDRILNR